ncbi:hypothetical protein CC1G_15366 [Coprinopsis cinerea okayama7|uniref:Uncharacterized protein n=1 Tax=Coprinopsis cinerea (strain Okayama-7 / 130 / ATCC MYA-4618 / FGSC 9003) TaxID=240176 RepID=D6RQ45_COPC7|nr:hypothetical protein CC1G_15366 [Coprinopsis cinerea okayama7\|eukprot:XP_002910459.1 hypothetical protein CC1G_15366 [Coprinopsis cinerea okayama7\
MSTSHQDSRMAEHRRQNENHDPPADSRSQPQPQSHQPPMTTMVQSRRHRDKSGLPYTIHFHSSTKEKPTRHLFLTGLPYALLHIRFFHGTFMDYIPNPQARVDAEERSHRVIHCIWIRARGLRFRERDMAVGREVESTLLGDGERVVREEHCAVFPATLKVFLHSRYWIGKEESGLEEDEMTFSTESGQTSLGA